MSNKKSVRNIAKALALAMGVCAVAAPLAACNNGKDPVLTLAADVLDGVFNPFFYTSGSDGEVVSQTQIGMLSSDKDGKLIASWDEPSVAFEYGVVTTGDRSLIDNAAKGDAQYERFYTDYYFALKDNIYFSDGVKLTKDDVLFNIYMYLDPAYTGSNTMYSVGIKGLSSYRAQSTDASEENASNAYFDALTNARLNMIFDWAESKTTTWNDIDNYEYYHGDPKVFEADLEKVHSLFKEEIASDWTYVSGADIENDYAQYKGIDGKVVFSDTWEIFLYNYGIITLDRKTRPNGQVGADGKTYYYELVNNYCGANHSSCKGDHSAETLQNYVYSAFFGDYKNNTLIDSYKSHLLEVISYYSTASTFREYVRSSVISYELKKDGELEVPEVSGIEVIRASQIQATNEETSAVYNIDLKGEYDVLHIRINGVDPKAIQNFAFTVAPGHYYSSTWDKVKTAYGHWSSEKEKPYFGVEFADTDFMDSIRVIHVPLGAGPYRATSGESSAVPDKNDSTAFFNQSTVYYERNELFMLGVPKIKNLRYQVVNNNMLYESVKSGAVHYASPSMDYETLGKLNGSDSELLRYESAQNLGYGYIGVSAQYVPNIWVRRAIMATLDPQLCVDYYGGGDNASIIRRPMSKTLTDYYDEEAFSDYSNYNYYPYGSLTGDGSDLEGLTSTQRMENAQAVALKYATDMDKGGCYLVGDTLFDPVSNKSLRLTFTIAGATDDHPAYSMLQNSVDILSAIGFDVSLKQDSRALSLLSSGALTVWAAAWSSSSDPDMYQVYHKNSTATSTRAWGYDALKLNGSSYELNLLDQLADKIEEGRETTIVSERKEIYTDAQNLLMQLAIEFPTYQRKVYYVWRKGVFNEDTMITGSEVGTYQSPLSRIWEVEFA